MIIKIDYYLHEDIAQAELKKKTLMDESVTLSNIAEIGTDQYYLPIYDFCQPMQALDGRYRP